MSDEELKAELERLRSERDPRHVGERQSASAVGRHK
jgi:hypothetical protein